MQMAQRDGLVSASQAFRHSARGTRGTIDVPAVGQRCGAQGTASEGTVSCCRGCKCGGSRTWLHSSHEGEAGDA